MSRDVSRSLVRSWTIGIAVITALIASACGGRDSDSAKDRSPSHRVHVTYVDPSRDIERYVRSSKVAENIAEEVTKGLRLPDDLTIAVGDGNGSPAFTYDERRITLPWSFVTLVHERLADAGYRGERLELGVVEVVAFVLTHELAHALINTMDLPITGHEEDAADDFAAIIAIGYARNAHIVTAASDFLRATSRTEAADDEAYFDEHSLSMQRFYSINCLAYGSNPKQFAHLAEATGIPRDRLETCPTQWHNTGRSWLRILAPYLRDGAVTVS